MDKFQFMVLEDLKALGKSQTAIAAGLKKRKIKGYRHVDSSCPVANYLADEYDADASVGNDSITINGVTVATPKTITAFISAFDAGKYPDLEENE